MVRVIVAEDHALVRQGLSLLLASAGGFSVVAETGLGSEAIDLARTLQPDLLLLDLALQDRSGIEVAQAVRRHSPATHIMVVTGNVYPGSVTQAFAAGVNGFVLKHGDGAELLNGIHAVLAGRRFMSKQVTEAIAGAGQRQPDHGTGLAPLLTQREQQIVRLIAAGRTNPEIAAELHISVLTARKHRQNVMLKLGLHNAADVTNYAVQSGLATAPNTGLLR